MSIAILLVTGTGLVVAQDTGDILDEYQELSPARVIEAPTPEPNDEYDAKLVKKGKYLVELLGCPSCHTDGALAGTPDPERILAGSKTGIAYTSPLKNKNPGVLYPANLTPDRETGLGNWTEENIMQMLRTGIKRDGRHTLSVMPWTSYARLSDEDAHAIVSYLRSLPPVRHEVPKNVRPGQKATSPYVHFGVYQRKP